MSLTSINLSTRRVSFAYAAWWLLWVVLEAAAIHQATAFAPSEIITDAVIQTILLAASGYVMCNSLRYYRPSLRNTTNTLVWSIMLAVIVVVVHRYTMGFVLPDKTDYTTFVINSYFFRGLFAWLMIVFIAILSWIWFALDDQKSMDQQREDAERLAREAELSKLRQQLQPHFLFNSLNSISALAGSRPEEARRMVQQLSDFLRGTLKKDDQQLVSLNDELQHLELYLDIEKVRFGHRLNTEVIREGDVSTMVLPALLLQPLVENAIKFGLYDTIGVITISIKARKENNYLVVSIQNPFDPTTTLPKGTGFGISAVQRRLYLLYARQDLLETGAQNNQFTSTIKIPQPL